VIFASENRFIFLRGFSKNTSYLSFIRTVGSCNVIPIAGKASYLWIYENLFQPLGDYFGRFYSLLCFMLICWSVGYILDKKKIYIKI
jgi:predicted acyltransferase